MAMVTSPEQWACWFKKENLGFGSRSWRYSMLVEDKKIIKIFSELGKSDNCPDDPFTVSDVDTFLDYLKQAN
jgi:peroxiredoxin